MLGADSKQTPKCWLEFSIFCSIFPFNPHLILSFISNISEINKYLWWSIHNHTNIARNMTIGKGKTWSIFSLKYLRFIHSKMFSLIQFLKYSFIDNNHSNILWLNLNLKHAKCRFHLPSHLKHGQHNQGFNISLSKQRGVFFYIFIDK